MASPALALVLLTRRAVLSGFGSNMKLPRKHTNNAQRLMASCKTRLCGINNAEHRSLALPDYENFRSPSSLWQLS